MTSINASQTKEIFDSGQGPNWGVDLVESDSDETNDGVRLTFLVRTSYMRHLRQTLSCNYDVWRVGCLDDTSEMLTEADIEHRAILMEQKALRACMMTGLYQRTMTGMIRAVKQSTANAKLHTPFIDATKRLSQQRHAKETQTVCQMQHRAVQATSVTTAPLDIPLPTDTILGFPIPTIDQLRDIVAKVPPCLRVVPMPDKSIPPLAVMVPPPPLQMPPLPPLLPPVAEAVTPKPINSPKVVPYNVNLKKTSLTPISMYKGIEKCESKTLPFSSSQSSKKENAFGLDNTTLHNTLSKREVARPSGGDLYLCGETNIKVASSLPLESKLKIAPPSNVASVIPNGVKSPTSSGTSNALTKHLSCSPAAAQNGVVKANLLNSDTSPFEKDLQLDSSAICDDNEFLNEIIKDTSFQPRQPKDIRYEGIKLLKTAGRGIVKRKPIEEHREEAVKKSKLNGLDERLMAMGLLNDPEPSEVKKTDAPVKADQPYIGCWYPELVAQMCNLNRILLPLKHERRISTERRFLDLFGPCDDPIAVINEDELNICRKRIANLVVAELTPFYEAKRVISRHLFKLVAKHITNHLMLMTYAPDMRLVKRTVNRQFCNNRTIESESDLHL